MLSYFDFRRTTGTALFFALSVILITKPGAADAAQSRTADELVALALANNPGPQALSAALVEAEAQMAASGAWPDPVLAWAVAPNTLDSEPLGDRHVLSLSQLVPWFGKRALAREQQAHMRDGVAHERTALRLAVETQTRAGHVRWYYLDQALVAITANQALLDDLAAVARSSYAAGRASQQSLLHAELRGVNLQRQSLQLQREKQQVLAQLRALVNSNAELGEAASLPVAPALPPLAELLPSVEAGNPHLAALLARAAASDVALARAQRDRLPDVRLNASYLGTLDPAEKRLQLGFSLELPLNQSRRRAQIDAARAQARRQQWAREDRRLELAASLNAVWAAAREADLSAELFRSRLLPLARQNLAAARADWASGAGDFAGVMDAEEDLLDARLGLERARSEAWVHRARLNELSGGLHRQTLLDEDKS